MRWQNILEAICAFPSIVLEHIVDACKMVALEERKLLIEGEYDEEEQE